MPPELYEQLQHTLGNEYHVGQELGGGGMARVFVAEDERLHRRIVVKVLSPDLAAGVSVERFRREIQLAGRLHHPHIVPVLDAGQSSALLFYTMPLIEGESLRALVARERQLPLDRALGIARDVGDALDYAHRENIVHRDIKPDNLLVESSGRAMVTDFGIARAIEKAADIESVTSTGLTLGTPTYMSPEQATAERSIDGRSDQYSLACVLYEMLAGSPPFTATTARALIAMHVSERPRSLLVVRPDLPTHVDAALQKALAKAPADRFRCVGDFIAALEGVPALTRRRSSAGVARIGTSRALVIGGIALLLALIALAVVVRWLGPPKPPPQPGADPRRIAVLYFEAPAGEDALASAARGITRDLITVLARVPTLDVISEAGLRRYVQRDPKALADELRVGTLISGTLEQRGDSLRLASHIVDPSGMSELASITFMTPLAGVLSMRDSLVQAIALQLRRRLSLEVQLHDWRSGTRSAQAWQLRQRAADLLSASTDAPTNPAAWGPLAATIRTADSLLARAAESDPAWDEAVVARGWLLWDHQRNVSGPSTAGVLLDSAIALADRVLSRDAQSARALELRGVMRAYRLAQVPGTPVALRDSAEDDLRRATTLDVTRARAWNTLSLVLQLANDSTGALVAAKRAIEMDPFGRDVERSMNRLIFAYLYRSQFDSAAALCTQARHNFPDDAALGACELSVVGWSGRGPAAIGRIWAAVAETERRAPFDLVGGVWPPGRYLAAAVLARSGLADSARSVIAATRAITDSSGAGTEFDGYEAYPVLLLGDRTRALDLLESFVGTDRGRALYVSRVPWFRELANDPRYRRLLGR